jgi:Major Facilitator Superfamily
LSEDIVTAWGWRIPFWFSLILAPVLYHIVKNTEESKLWSERNEQKETEKLIRGSEENSRPAVFDLLGSPFRRRQLAGMIGVLGAVTSSFYTLFLWTPVYLSELRGIMSQADADMLNFCVIGSYIFLILIAGKLSDTFPHRMDLIRIGLPGIIVAAPVMFGMFESESWYGYLFGQLQYAVCLSFVHGGMAAWEVELWMADPSLSFTGVAIGHNVASTLFGGTMPLMATFLFYRAKSVIGNNADAFWPRLYPGFYISVLACISMYCISHVIRHPHDVRTGDTKLRDAVENENKRFKQAKRAKKKKKQMIEEQLKAVNPNGMYSSLASICS